MARLMVMNTRLGTAAAAALALLAAPAAADDFGREFLALTLAVKVVSSQEEAEGHIAMYGSGHSEAILTRAHDRAMRFLPRSFCQES